MDLDAEIKKLNKFRNDLHLLFPGGADGFAAAVAAARNGEPIERPQRALDAPEGPGHESRLSQLAALGARLESILPAVEGMLDRFDEVVGRLASLEETVTALQQGKDAPEKADDASADAEGTKPPADGKPAS